MSRLLALLLALSILLVPLAQPATAEQGVEFFNDCETTSEGGIFRWEAKTDPTTPDATTQIRNATVEDMLEWRPLRGNWATDELQDEPRRPGRERLFYRVPGAVQRVALDPDGDVHIEVAEVDDFMRNRVIFEIPAGENGSPFCEARTTLFDAMSISMVTLQPNAGYQWERDNTGPRHLAPLTIEVVGRPFYDGIHCNRRGLGHGHGTKYADGTCWEIHPVLELLIVVD
jgi:hypothetical protein